MTKENCPKFEESAFRFLVGVHKYSHPVYVTRTSGEEDNDRELFFDKDKALILDDESRANLIYMRLVLNGEKAFIMKMFEDHLEGDEEESFSNSIDYN